LLLMASNCASHLPSSEAQLFCAVEGEALLTPNVDARQVCDRVQIGLTRAVGRPFRLAPRSAGQEPTSAEAVRARLSFSRPGIAAIKVEHQRGGSVSAYPEVSIAVSDQPLTIEIVDLLVAEVVRANAGLS
jgi:hypothetical protein